MSHTSSEILEQQFGDTSIRILSQDDNERIISTAQNSTGEILELSWVRFKHTNTYPQIHRSIVNGRSIGKAFRTQNIRFTRKLRASGSVETPLFVQKLFKSQDQATVIEVSIYVGREEIHYADITEIYAPQVNWPSTAATSSKDIVSYLDAISQRLASLETA